MSFSNYIKENNNFEKLRYRDITQKKDFYSNYKANIKSMSGRKKIKNLMKNRILTPNFIKLEERNKFLNNLSSKENNNETNENINNINEIDDYNSIYENIILLLNNLINDNSNNSYILCKLLQTIYEFIYNINNEKNKEKIINRLKSPVKRGKSYIQMFYNNLSKENINNDKLKNKKSKLIHRINSSLEKYHINEFNYLIYINELNKKIFDLEQKLNIDSVKQNLEKEKIKNRSYLQYNKFYLSKDLKIRNQSFSINSPYNNYKQNSLLDNKKEKLKISLKDIFINSDYEDKIIAKDLKLFKNKKYLISHPKLKYYGYNNNNERISNIVKDQLNKMPMETSGFKMFTKFQSKKKSNGHLSFSPIKFKTEGIKTNNYHSEGYKS